MQILAPHGRRFEVALELLQEGRSFIFDGVRFSLASDGLLVVATESSGWPIKDAQTALTDLRRTKSVADHLAGENPLFEALYRKYQHLFILVNYFGHGGEMEVARLVNEQVVWANT